MQSTTIKVPQLLHDTIARMAKEKGTTMAAVIEESLEISQRTIFWEEFEKVMNTPQARAEAETATQMLGGTLTDGLEPEDWSDLYPEVNDWHPTEEQQEPLEEPEDWSDLL